MREEKPVTQEKINQMTKHIDVPVVVQRQVPAIQKVQKAAEVPQVQHIDRIMDLPAEDSGGASNSVH